MVLLALRWPPWPTCRPHKQRVRGTISSPIIIILTLLMVMWIPLAVTQSALKAKSENICQSIDVRNSPVQLVKLQNCTVIEGSLQIVLIEKKIPQDFENLTFPNLVEITDYLLLWRVDGLTTLAKLFPNLSVIRGRRLFYNYAFVTFDMSHLNEIGLHNLTKIERGAVLIEKNHNLCFVNTINWHLIASGKDGTRPLQHKITVSTHTRLLLPRVNPSSHSFFLSPSLLQNNKQQCNDQCPDHCPQLNGTSGPHLCWNAQHCQRGQYTLTVK